MINVRLNKELEDKLKKYTNQHQKTKSSVVHEALELYLSNVKAEKSAYDLGEDLFGSTESGRSDSSTKYKSHLKSKISAKHSH